MVSKGLERGLEQFEIGGKIETIQISAFLLDRLEYLEESWRSAETCSQIDLSESPSAKASEKNL